MFYFSLRFSWYDMLNNGSHLVPKRAEYLFIDLFIYCYFIFYLLTSKVSKMFQSRVNKLSKYLLSLLLKYMLKMLDGPVKHVKYKKKLLNIFIILKVLIFRLIP